MMKQQIIFSIVRTIHNLGSAIWVGGLITLGAVVIPAVKNFGKKSEEVNKLVSLIYQRIMKLVFVTIPVLFITGIMLARPNPKFKGFFHFSNAYSSILSIKLFLVFFMLITIVLRKRSLKKFMKTKDMKYAKQSEKYVIVNMIFGIIVIFLSSLAAVI